MCITSISESIAHSPETFGNTKYIHWSEYIQNWQLWKVKFSWTKQSPYSFAAFSKPRWHNEVVVALIPWICSLLNRNRSHEVTLVVWICPGVGPSLAHLRRFDQNLFIYSFVVSFLDMIFLGIVTWAFCASPSGLKAVQSYFPSLMHLF